MSNTNSKPTFENGAQFEHAPRSSSVVPEKYRRRYEIASTTGRSSGTWLSETMDRALGLTAEDENGKICKVKGAKTDPADVAAICTANGLALNGKWARFYNDAANGRNPDSPGWQGRFRMNAVQLLAPIVAEAGDFFYPDGRSLAVDPAWRKTNLRTIRTKQEAAEQR